MKDRIARACAELLRTHCVDEITVRDIAEACGISRQAFYYYFENIESVAAYSVDKALEQLRETCMHEDDPKEVLRIIIRNYRSQYCLLKHLMQSRLQPNIMRYYFEVLFSGIRDPIVKNSGEKVLDSEDLDLEASFFAFGLGGMLYERCGEPDLNVEKFADDVYRVIVLRITDRLLKQEE